MVLNTPAHGSGPSTLLKIAFWRAPGGTQTDLTLNGKSSSLLAPKGKNVYIIDPDSKEALSVPATRTALEQLVGYTPMPSGPLRNVRRLAPVKFLGYLCTVREGTQVVNGSLLHSQIWEAQINHRTEELREFSQGADGRVFLFEAVSVQTYLQAPAGLLTVPKGYTVVAQK